MTFPEDWGSEQLSEGWSTPFLWLSQAASEMWQRDAVSPHSGSHWTDCVMTPSVKMHVNTPLSRRASPVYLNPLSHRGCSFQPQQHKRALHQRFSYVTKCHFSLCECICTAQLIQDKCVTYITKTLKKRLLLLTYPLCQRCARTQVSWSHSSGLCLDYTAK